MLQRIAPKATTPLQTLAMPLDGEDAFAPASQATASPGSFYTVTIIVRIALMAALLMRAIALWY